MRKGFTLIELLVVIGVIALIVTTILLLDGSPNFTTDGLSDREFCDQQARYRRVDYLPAICRQYYP